MSYVLYLRTQAERDLADAMKWYEGQRIGLGEEFYQAIDQVFARIMGQNHKRGTVACASG